MTLTYGSVGPMESAVRHDPGMGTSGNGDAGMGTLMKPERFGPSFQLSAFINVPILHWSYGSTCSKLMTCGMRRMALTLGKL